MKELHFLLLWSGIWKSKQFLVHPQVTFLGEHFRKTTPLVIVPKEVMVFVVGLGAVSQDGMENLTVQSRQKGYHQSFSLAQIFMGS